VPGFLTAAKKVLKDGVRFEYQYFDSDIITLGHDRHIYGERIEAGWILTVKHCYLYLPEIGTPDVVVIYVEAGPHEMIVRARGKEVGRRGMSGLTPFYVGEYQRVVGYAPNAEVGNQIKLTVTGYLTPLWDWRKLTGRED